MRLRNRSTWNLRNSFNYCRTVRTRLRQTHTPDKEHPFSAEREIWQKPYPPISSAQLGRNHFWPSAVIGQKPLFLIASAYIGRKLFLVERGNWAKTAFSHCFCVNSAGDIFGRAWNWAETNFPHCVCANLAETIFGRARSGAAIASA